MPSVCLMTGFPLLIAGLAALSSPSMAFMSNEERQSMRQTVKEMFNHGYYSYMKYAFPADELMPLSCKGRFRGTEHDRGDIDEVLGNFSLTLVDSMDTLAVLGEWEEFERAVRLVVENVHFDTDAVVSLFEVNIRVLGGLLGGHTMALAVKRKGNLMTWYDKQLIDLGVDLADRLLVAFNTTTGIPYPKINLKYGIHHPNSRLGNEQDTCTACAGTMIMEFGALSRFTGNPVYERKALEAMEAIWQFRSHHSDLVGTVINIHNGDWIRRDSGVGAGIDSYYEYCFKAYILLGEDTYLNKFEKHYAAITKYLRHGVMWLDVLMHQPEKPIRMFMDALQAFWPGLQVMFGDLKPAIETHHMLYKVAKRHKFLPEAFTTNLDVYWAQHPLRPEFAESTYLLYEATKDPHYLDVGKHIVDTLQDYARVPCGYAAVKDVRTLTKEDKMDSFVLAETFKYLYLLFSIDDDANPRTINTNDYVFTTEAHLLPLTLSNYKYSNASINLYNKKDDVDVDQANNNNSNIDNLDEAYSDYDHSVCHNNMWAEGSIVSYAETVRRDMSMTQPNSKCSNDNLFQLGGNVKPIELLPVPNSILKSEPKINAAEFKIDNQEHLKILKEMGITTVTLDDGKIQLMHQAATALTPDEAHHGIKFMQDMILLAKEKGEQLGEVSARVVQVLSPPHNGNVVFSAGPASFGNDLSTTIFGVAAPLVEAVPFHACDELQNSRLLNVIVMVERGNCMFAEKVRNAQRQGAIGVIVVDNTIGTSSEAQQVFSMSGDSTSSDISIPSVFVFSKEANLLRQYLKESEAVGQPLELRLSAKAIETGQRTSSKINESEKHVEIDSSSQSVTQQENIQESTTADSSKKLPAEKQSNVDSEKSKEIKFTIKVNSDGVNNDNSGKAEYCVGGTCFTSVNGLEEYIKQLDSKLINQKSSRGEEKTVYKSKLGEDIEGT